MKRTITILVPDTFEELSADEIATLLEQSKTISKFLEGAEAFAKAQIEAKPGCIPGWTLGPGRNSREWKSDAAAIDAMSNAGINDPYERKLRSVAQAEKLVGDPSALSGAWENVPGKPTLKQTPGGALAGTKPNFGF